MKTILPEITNGGAAVEIDLDRMAHHSAQAVEKAVQAEAIEECLALYTIDRVLLDDFHENEVEGVLWRLRELKKAIDAVRKGIEQEVEAATDGLNRAVAILKNKIIYHCIDMIQRGEKDAARVVLKAYGIILKEEWHYRAKEGEELDPRYLTKDSLGFTVPDHDAIKATVALDKEKTNIRGVEVYNTYNIAYGRQK